MESEEFRVRGKEMVDYIADYLDTVRTRKVYPDVQPGYLHKLVPDSAPQQGEAWSDIMADVDRVIMPGVVHWQSPHMHAYFPALTSFPSILGDFLSSSLNNIPFTWASSPAATELDTVTMNWLGKMIGLPEQFLHTKDGSGGGVTQTTASEATLVSLLAARTRALQQLCELNPGEDAAELLGHLVAYCSDQAHSSVEKAGLIGLVRMRYIESDENQSMRGPALEQAIVMDKEAGLVPFWVCATLGTTGSVAFDNLQEIGPMAIEHGLWVHVDAAYAGSAFVCPEYRHWMKGIELVDSIAFNPSKWLMVNFDCTAMWVKDSTAIHRTFNVNPIYLRHENSGKAIDYMFVKEFGSDKELKKTNHKNGNIVSNGFTPTNGHFGFNTDSGLNGHTDSNEYTRSNENLITKKNNAKNGHGDTNGYKVSKNVINKNNGLNTNIKSNVSGSNINNGGQIQLEDQYKKEHLHWQIPLSRRFRSLKLWFVLRSYGVAGIQKHIRESVRLAQKFEALVLADSRFEIPQSANLGMVVFRLRGDNALTERLLRRLNARGHIHCVPALFKNIYVIRFTITSQKTLNEDLLEDWNEVKTVAAEILKEVYGTDVGNIAEYRRAKISLKETRSLNAGFGTSLLLANSPMSPKIVNGSFVALRDYNQLLSSCAQTFADLQMEPKDSPAMRRRIRGIKTVGKKFSLDSCMDMVQGLMIGDEEKDYLTLVEDEREDITSNGSSPNDKSSRTSSPLASSSTSKNIFDANQLNVPQTPSKQYRSKSVDVTLTRLKNVTAKLDDLKCGEIFISQAGDFLNKLESLNREDSNEIKSEEDKSISDEAISVNGATSQKIPDVEISKESKVTITGPGSYIKKIVQQFSECSFDSRDDSNRFESFGNLSTSGQRALSIREKADAICKKCLHFKGTVPKT